MQLTLLAPLALLAAAPAAALIPRHANATTPLTLSVPANTSSAPVSLLTPTANLSTTAKPTSSVVLLTTSLPGGHQSTVTSFVGAGGGASPTAGAGGAGPTPSGATQPGAAPRGVVGSQGAWAALALAVGVGALAL